MRAAEWRLLNAEFRQLKTKYLIPQEQELKWANLWSLRIIQKDKKTIKTNSKLYPFRKHNYKDLIDFVAESLMLIKSLDERKIIITFTKNLESSGYNEKSMLAMHLQEHMQRIEMELETDDSNLGVVFFDPVNKKKNEYLKEIYYDLFEKGDYIDNYGHIKDSLNIENSHHSVGIQLSDYIAGSFSALLKSTDQNNYMRGVQMFFEAVYPYLRRDVNGQILGYGIREVPRNESIRTSLKNHIEKHKLPVANIS